jgi:nicotinamidase-related amidase
MTDVTTDPGLPTLRSLEGLPLDPPDLAASTVVVIDAQTEYLGGPLALAGMDPALDALARLLDAARGVGTPVVHIAHQGGPGAAFDPATGGRIIDRIAPVGDEPVVSKSLPNAFAGTDLAERLRAIGDRPLVLCGFMTHMCVSATARAALDLGFAATVAADACATRALPGAAGGEDVPARDVHRTALAELADLFAIVAPVSSLTGG